MPNSEQELLDKLRKIERLFAGATTAGERDAAADAMHRITRRLQETSKTEKPIEYRFRLTDDWSKQLFIALLRRYSLKPYRYSRQRRTTVMVRVPRSFVDVTLWPEYLELSAVLRNYLNEVTARLIAKGVHSDSAEPEVVEGDYLE